MESRRKIASYNVYFVGRDQEQKEVRRALREGKHVIISGKFGMGRTTLINHFSHMYDGWRFFIVDFSKPPAHICNQILRELFPKQKSECDYVKYKLGRFQIMTLELEDKRKHVLVLDNITRVTDQKLDLLRHLSWEDRFLFIGIVESFLPQNDLFRLRTWLSPCITIALHHLARKDVIEFFQRFSTGHNMNWTERQISSLAAASGGYPLRMKEIATRELERAKVLIGYTNTNHDKLIEQKNQFGRSMRRPERWHLKKALFSTRESSRVMR
jgi:hypothetical protein